MTFSGLLRRLPLPDRSALFAGLRSYLAALGTFLTLAVLLHWAHESYGVLVLGVVVAFSLDRTGRGQERRTLLVGLPIVTVCVAALGALMREEPPLGSALFVVLVFASIHVRRYGPRASGIGRLMALPLLAMFMSPVPVDPRGIVIWSVVASLLAVVWNWIASALLARAAPPRPAPAASASPAQGSVHTRLGAQAGLALALAFTTGHLLFPDHWSWTVITTLVVTIGARSRGHVLHKGVQRFAGALIGAFTATLIAGPVNGHPIVAVVVIFAYLLAGLILREVDYAYWSFCMTSMLAVLYGLIGQAGPEFLAERLLQIVLGTACAILPAFVLMPIRTEAVVRRHLSRTLEALGDLLKGPDEETKREFEQRAQALKVAAEPVLALRRIVRLLDAVLRRPSRGPGLAECVESLLSCAGPITALAVQNAPALDGAALDGAALDGAALDGAALDGAALDGAALDGAALDGAALEGAALPGSAGSLSPSAGERARERARETASLHGALRRNIGTIRLTLGRRPAPEWVPVEIPPHPDPRMRALADIDAALRSIHAGVAVATLPG